MRRTLKLMFRAAAAGSGNPAFPRSRIERKSSGEGPFGSKGTNPGKAVLTMNSEIVGRRISGRFESAELGAPPPAQFPVAVYQAEGGRPPSGRMHSGCSFAPVLRLRAIMPGLLRRRSVRSQFRRGTASPRPAAASPGAFVWATSGPAWRIQWLPKRALVRHLQMPTVGISRKCGGSRPQGRVGDRTLKSGTAVREEGQGHSPRPGSGRESIGFGGTARSRFHAIG